MAALRWLTSWPGTLVLVWLLSAAFMLAMLHWQHRVARRALKEFGEDRDDRLADVRRRIRQGARR